MFNNSKYIPAMLALGLLFCFAAPSVRVYAQEPDDKVPALIAGLKNPDVKVRRKSAEDLINFAYYDLRMVPPLIGALKDADPSVRKFAAVTLATTRDPRAVAQLIELSKDSNLNLRLKAVDALGQIGSPRAVPRLIELSRTDKAVRPYALSALTLIADESSIRTILDFAQIGEFAEYRDTAGSMGQIGDDAAATTLLSMLRQPDHPQRPLAISALGYMQEAAADADLLQLLEDEDYDYRESVIDALGNIGDPRAAEPAARLLGDVIGQSYAIRTLGRLGTPYAVDVLSTFILKKFDNPADKADAYDAITALGRIRDPKAVPVLMKALEECGKDDQYKRELLIQTLGYFGDSRAVNLIVPFVAKGTGQERYFAIEALRQIASPAAIPVLTPLLEDKDPQIRSEAAVALASIPDAAAVKPLLAAILKEHQVYSGMTRLPKLLAHNKAMTTADYVSLLECKPFSFFDLDLFMELSQIGFTDPQILQVMISILKQGEYWQEEQFDEAFRPYGEAAITELLDIVKNRQGNGTAERILSRLGDKRAIEVIKKTYGLERMDMLIPLGRLKDPDIFEPVMALLSKPVDDLNDEFQHAHAAEALGALGDLRAVEAIAGLLRNPKIREPFNRIAIVRALGDLGDAKATDALLAALDTDDPFVVQEVVTALGKLPPNERITRVLIDTLFDARDDAFRDGERRALAAVALAKNTDPAVTPALITVLRQGGSISLWAGRVIDVLAARDDPSAGRVLVYYLGVSNTSSIAASRALGQLKYVGAELPLIRALRDPNPEMRAAAANSLTQITGQNLGEDPAAWQAWWLKNHEK